MSDNETTSVAGFRTIVFVSPATNVTVVRTAFLPACMPKPRIRRAQVGQSVARLIHPSWDTVVRNLCSRDGVEQVLDTHPTQDVADNRRRYSTFAVVGS